MVYTCGGKRTFDMTNNPIRSAFQEPDIPTEKRLDYYRGLLNDDFEVKLEQPSEASTIPEAVFSRDIKRTCNDAQENDTNKRQRSCNPDAEATHIGSESAVVFCTECPYHCPVNPFRVPNTPQPPPCPNPPQQPFPNPPQQPFPNPPQQPFPNPPQLPFPNPPQQPFPNPPQQPFPNPPQQPFPNPPQQPFPNLPQQPFPNPPQQPFPNPPQQPFPNPPQQPFPNPSQQPRPKPGPPLPPAPQPLPGQKVITMKFPTAYLGDVDLRVVPRGNNSYELIQDTGTFHARPLILKIVDSRLIPNFNPDNPPTAHDLATMPPKIINMDACQHYKSVLQSLRNKTNRTASEEVRFYEALVELNAIDLLFLMDQYFQFLKQFCGIENISNNNSMFLVAVSNIPNLDNAFAFFNSFYCGDGKSAFYPLSTADVTSHETSHLVVAQIAGLVYQGHSGGLNESYSDVFALFFERWLYLKFNEDVDQSNNLLGSWNYTIGEACGRRLFVIRNFKDPFDAPQPSAAYYRDVSRGWQDPNSPIDNGFVHSISGISNKCAYEVIQAVGWDIAGKVLFLSLTKLKPNSSFIDYRDALKASASEFNCLEQIMLCLNTVGLNDQAVSDWTPKQ